MTHDVARRAVRFLGAAAYALWLPVALVLIWWFTSDGSKNLYYVPLSDIWHSLKTTWVSNRMSTDILPSLWSLFLGLSIALGIGVTLGYVIGRIRPIRVMAAPILDLFRAIPGLALVPLFIALFGPSPKSENLLIAWSCTWPILLNTIDGVAGLDAGYRDAARSMRMRGVKRIIHVELPAAAARIVAGFNLSLSIGVVAMVAIELFSAARGIGYQLGTDQVNFDIEATYAGTVIAGIIGYSIATGFRLFERRFLLRWQVEWQASGRGGAGR